jgi:hypothetical protein
MAWHFLCHFVYIPHQPLTAVLNLTEHSTRPGTSCAIFLSFTKPHIFIYSCSSPVISINTLLHYNKHQTEIKVTCCMICNVKTNTHFIHNEDHSSDDSVYAVLTLTYKLKLHKPVGPYINNNQHNALFIFSLFSYHTATCFGCVSSPSAGGKMCSSLSGHAGLLTVNCTISHNMHILPPADTPKTCSSVITEDKQCIVLAVIHTIRDARSA